ncbi:DUF4382 domain-containing protein [Flavobacterium frigoris]|uniref:Lipoprotein n=1 Tax=Flavobacterium frigoris (strain PS1) TaxID=1086011 RepID=H7FNU5_FLAFP|nr:DUF4382 domain-containing protein [Flavobacterium frigoris]EIA10084.1 lipoprotein [Flavobacterium frigoris PS1]
MKRIKFCLKGFFAITLMGLFFLGCDSNNDTPENSRLTVRMADAPGNYDAVFVELVDVMIKNADDADGSKGWVSIGNVTPGIHDLLKLTGGVNVVLADNTVPSGYLGQIRLLLGDKNTVVKNGVRYDLKTPSAQQSGLKLKINQTLVAGATYEFMLDFDVKSSVVVQAGNSGNYNLHPVIRVSTTATSGVIKGTVSPIPTDAKALGASVKVGDVTISAFANDLGMFQLNGIPAGTYDVKITYELAAVEQTKIVYGVIVMDGKVTDMGSTSLP